MGPQDGFEPEFKSASAAYSEALAERCFAQIERLARWLEVVVDGVSKLRPGRALLVANHASGLGAAFAMAAIRRETGRRVWALGEHVWCELPVVRRLAIAVGAVDGTAANADRLLSADQLIFVLPDGFREMAGRRELGSGLLGGHRYDFVRAAIRNEAPIVPLVFRGFDESELGEDGYEPGHARPRTRPVAAALPPRLFLDDRALVRRVTVGDPISPRFGPSCATELSHVRVVRRQVEDALQEMLGPTTR